MFAGRSIIIDVNTLDPTLQLMLSGLRLGGIDGLVVNGDPVASRAQMRQSLQLLPGPQIHVMVEDLTLPGPAGPIPARHYSPASGTATDLLVFYHGGGWALGDLDTVDALGRLTWPRRRGARPVRRLPAGPRAPGAGRRRRRLRGVPLCV